MVDASGTTKYTYTASGQLLTEDGPFGSDTLTNTYSNRLRTGLSLQQPTGVWTNGFSYDATKRLTGVTSPAGTFGYSYDSSLFTHHASRITLPNTSYITNTYDGNARLTGTYLKNSVNTVLDSYAYSYNPANQRTNLTRLASTVAYRYDKIGQLTVADSSVSVEDTGYSYDHAWNVSSVTNSVATNAFLVNGSNELTNWTAGVATYDANGNLTTRTNDLNAQYNYDDENRLVSVLINGGALETDFIYDGLGRLRTRAEVQYVGGGTFESDVHYLYDGFRVIQERNAFNGVLASYTRGNDLSGSLEGAGGIGGLLARSGSAHNYYFADGNGNITYMLNNSQSMVASYRYDPFGNTISSSGSLANDNVYRFSSKEFLVNSGLYYFGYRFYDPGLQRWINRDPVGERGGDNLYTFVRNDPICKTDSLGLTAHLWPLNDVIYNDSSYNVYVHGDWVAINFYNSGLGTGTSRPFSYLELSTMLAHVAQMPVGTTVTLTEPQADYVLPPRHNTERDWKSGLTDIVDADFLTGAQVPVYLDPGCSTRFTGKRIHVGASFSMVVHNCPKGCKGVYVSSGTVEY